MDNWRAIDIEERRRMFPVGSRVVQHPDDIGERGGAVVIADDDPRYLSKFSHKPENYCVPVLQEDGNINGWYLSTDHSSRRILFIERMPTACPRCGQTFLIEDDYLCPSCREGSYEVN